MFPDADRVTEFVPDRIWTKRVPLQFLGLPMGARMTVIRLREGGLFIHSPVPLDNTTRREIDALGPVRCVVAPNRLHHLSIGDYATAYPAARIYASPKLVEKRKDVAFHGILGDAPESEWADEIDQVILHGSLYMDEVIFCDVPGRTLIVTDTLQCVTPQDSRLMRVVGRFLLGSYGTPAVTSEQRIIVRDKDAARAAVRHMLSWDFDRIIMAHGPLVEANGKEVFRKAFTWLLGKK